MTGATRSKVLLFGPVRSATEALKKFSEQFDVILDKSANREEFVKALATPAYQSIVGIYATYYAERKVGNVDKELISHLPQSVKFYSHVGAGYDKVDANALLARKIQMSNTPGPVCEATATTAIYLLIGALRNFNQKAEIARNGDWGIKSYDGRDLKGKVFGILGMGNIGASIRDKAVPFHFKKIVYHNRHQLPKEEEGIAEYVADLDDFLAQCDAFAISVPLNAGTHHLLNKETIAKVKPGAVIVNTARGAIIDEDALVEALDSGHILSAGLDVFEFEPKIHPKLLSNPRVLLLPHAGTSTVETHIETEARALENIESGIKTGKLLDIVPEQKGKF